MITHTLVSCAYGMFSHFRTAPSTPALQPIA
jgi:hypothetical protein